jgi:hypothetical protein
MSTLGGSNPTLLDIAKRLDPNGRVSAVAEMLSQENEILADMPYYEGNLPTGHRTTVRTGLPTAAWRKLNKGIAASKSHTAQIDEACGMLEATSLVDVEVAKLNGNTAEFRLSEATAFIESMNQTMASTLFYGDTALHPERFLGLAPRFDDVPTTANGAENKDNVIDAGGTGADNTSIWLVGWGQKSVHGIYPKGSQAGLQHMDKGEQRVLDSDSNSYYALCDWYQWKNGIVLKDWRYVVRIANIDVSDLTKNAASGADLIDLMTRSLERIHSLEGVTPVFYCNRTIRSFLRRQHVAKIAGSTLSWDMVGGKRIGHFCEVPLRRTDALLNNEARVT